MQEIEQTNQQRLTTKSELVGSGSGSSSLANNTKKFQLDQFDEKAIFLCQFCGGESCSHEDYRKNKKQPNAIDGLHSNWITQNILAMQRPSQRLIKQYEIYKKFKTLGINTILNLQEPGQHPYCGDGIIPTIGFSYIPQKFYQKGIHFFNQSWEDMTATTFQHMMKIMNIFDMSINKQSGKIAVHCHAGRGRTLLVICSWLIYNNRMKAQQTIDLAILKRQGVLTRSSQRDFLYQFQQGLENRWKSFPTNYQDSFEKFIGFQTTSLLHKQKKILNWTPFLHGTILEFLRNRIKPDANLIAKGILNCQDEIFKNTWNIQSQKKLKQYKKQINQLNLNFLNDGDIRIQIQLLFDFYQEMPYTIINSHTLDTIIEESTKNLTKLQLLQLPATVHDIEIHGIAVILDFIFFIKSLEPFLMANQNLIDSLYLKIAMILFSKKIYNPKIYKIDTRHCYIEDRNKHKYINGKIQYLSKFLSALAKEIPQNYQHFAAIMLKFRKIDANLHYFTEGHRKQNKFYDTNQVKQIYSQSKVK